MTPIAKNRKETGKANNISVFVLVIITTMLIGCATTANTGKRGSGVVTSREATEIWHSYEIRSDYNYYYSGPDSQPNYIIGIDKQYRLTSKGWKPVDLTPAMLKNWFNFIRPRVGISQDPFGAFIVGPNNKRVGLWYSVKDWRAKGSATVGEDNTISVIRPALPRAGEQLRRRKY